jgi:hypothetical protein
VSATSAATATNSSSPESPVSHDATATNSSSPESPVSHDATATNSSSSESPVSHDATESSAPAACDPCDLLVNILLVAETYNFFSKSDSLIKLIFSVIMLWH